MSNIEEIAFDERNGGLSSEEWKAGFEALKQSGTYELVLGDLVPAGIDHCTRKNLLIFNTSHLAHSPIYVVTASTFGGFADSDIPVCLAYDQAHYEAMVPNSVEDINKTIVLMRQFLQGHYTLEMIDIPLFKKTIVDLRKNYDDDFPVLGHCPKRKQSEQDNKAEEKRHFRGKRTRSFSKQDDNVQNNVYEQMKKQEIEETAIENVNSPPQLTKKKTTVKKENVRKESTEPLSKVRENDDRYKNSFSGLSDIKDEQDECSMSLEDLKLIKGKERSKSQTRRYQKLMRLKRMEAQTDAQKDQTNKRHKERVMKSRERESLEEKNNRNTRNAESMVKSRDKESLEEKEKRNRRNAESMLKSRDKLSLKEKEKVKQKK